MREKLAGILTKIFGIGLIACLVWAFVMGILYVTAFIFSGNTAEVISAFIKNIMMPALYLTGSVTVVVGIVRMYLLGEKEFVFEPKPKEK